jgi:hypothetical protein
MTNTRSTPARHVLTAVALAVISGTLPASGQELNIPNGLWLGGGAIVGGSVLDQYSARPWERIGSFGPSIGVGLSLGYDAQRLGAAVDVDVTGVRAGDRTGANIALAALLRWAPLWQPLSGMQSRIAVGYVRYQFGGTRIAPSELPPTLFRSGTPSLASQDPRLYLLGNGMRAGVTAAHEFGPRTSLMFGVGADVVYFDTATYQSSDLSLAQAGWGVMPRVTLGLRFHPSRYSQPSPPPPRTPRPPRPPRDRR